MCASIVGKGQRTASIRVDGVRSATQSPGRSLGDIVNASGEIALTIRDERARSILESRTGTVTEAAGEENIRSRQAGVPELYRHWSRGGEGGVSLRSRCDRNSCFGRRKRSCIDAIGIDRAMDGIAALDSIHAPVDR